MSKLPTVAIKPQVDCDKTEGKARTAWLLNGLLEQKDHTIEHNTRQRGGLVIDVPFGLKAFI